MRQGEGDEFWFVSRKTDMIVSANTNIWPAEVEQVLLAHPGVRDAAVTGLPDPMLGQRLVALVAFEDGFGPEILEALRDAAATQLVDESVPERFIIVPRIPKNDAGKTDRRSLRAMAE